jgi:hypothetical protein
MELGFKGNPNMRSVGFNQLKVLEHKNTFQEQTIESCGPSVLFRRRISPGWCETFHRGGNVALIQRLMKNAQLVLLPSTIFAWE